MSLRDRIVGKQGIDQMMARMDDELRGINGGHTLPTLENIDKYKAAGDQQQGFHWMYCICVALFCVQFVFFVFSMC